ncbi:hypothetical protein [Streptomyces murinus]|uniref:hypothetical protein n=1 Tax=Streptomyces murinus TaxID=33900 RepID=UPI0037F3CEC6
MAVIDHETQTALDAASDRYGRITDRPAAAAARYRRTQAVLATYTTHLAAHGEQLLLAAHTALDQLPDARHTSAWRQLLTALGNSHAAITHVLAQPAAPGTDTEQEQHTFVWPHLMFWADYGYIAAHLADQQHQPTEPELSGTEKGLWTERARAARSRGDLDLIESWYATDGRLITLAHLVRNDTSTVIALAGDPGAPGWEVIGHYAHESEAVQALPRAAPPGILFADGPSRFNRPATVPEQQVQELLRGIEEARAAGEVSEALLTAAQAGHQAGPLMRLERLLDTAATFAYALETVQGQQIGARLGALGRQLAFLTCEVRQAAEDLDATVAVLPPHRTPNPPRSRPRPALTTTPATPASPSAPPAHARTAPPARA